MALIYKIRRALGFGVTDDDEDYEALAADALKAGIPTPPFHEPEPTTRADSEAQPQPAEEEPRQSVPADRSARMIEILVELVRNSMSSPRFRSELNRISGRFPDDRRGERAQLLEELERYKAQAARIEELEEELKQARLTAQRQQRVYTDRINELTERNNLTKNGDTEAPISELPDPLIEDLQRQLTSREETIVELKNALTALQTKVKMSDEMINSLNKRAAQARDGLKTAEAEHIAEREKLESQLSMANSQIENLTRRIEEMKSAVAEAESESKRGRRKKRKGMESDKDTGNSSEFADASWLVAESESEQSTESTSGSRDRAPKDLDDDRQLSLW